MTEEIKSLKIKFRDGMIEYYHFIKDYQESLHGNCIRIVTMDNKELIIPIPAIVYVEKTYKD